MVFCIEFVFIGLGLTYALTLVIAACTTYRMVGSVTSGCIARRTDLVCARAYVIVAVLA